MLNFNFHVPTRIRFGRGKIADLGKEILNYGDKVLLVYGGGSIKRSGLYDQVLQIFQDNGITHVELSEVQPNPRISSVRQGAALCKENEVDLVLAVGGGSTIDCAKITPPVPGMMVMPGTFARRARITRAFADRNRTDSGCYRFRMNPNAVISNDDTEQKLGTGSPLLFPRFSILDPEYTFTVP